MFNLQHYYVSERVSDVQSTFVPCCLIVATVWPCRSIVCLCACCCSKCSGLCAAWMPLSSPTSWTPSSPWSWPGTFRLTHRVKIFKCRRTPQASDYFATLTECCLSSEHQKMCYTALVLTMIFSMGEQVPYHHYGMDEVLYLIYILCITSTPAHTLGGPNNTLSYLNALC